MSIHSCNQDDGNISALIAVHPDLRCNTLCGSALVSQGMSCTSPDQNIVMLTGLASATQQDVHKCIGNDGIPLKVVEFADWTDKNITLEANKGQHHNDGDCVGGTLLVTFLDYQSI